MRVGYAEKLNSRRRGCFCFCLVFGFEDLGLRLGSDSAGEDVDSAGGLEEEEAVVEVALWAVNSLRRVISSSRVQVS